MSDSEPPFDWLSGFEPQYDGLDKDCERVDDLIVELSDAGKIEVAEGQSLYGAYCVDCHRWLEAKYFEQRLFDDIENYHTASGEQPIAWPYPGQMQAAERFVVLSERIRARRLWRNHLSLIKETYWHLVSYRNRGFNPLKVGGESESEQRRRYDEYVSHLPDKKALLLEVLDGAREFFVRVGASEVEIMRLERDIAAVETEQRTRPAGNPDSRDMSEDLFWEIVEGDQSAPIGERIEHLAERLAEFTPKAIKNFNRILRTKWNGAYRTDIWALAYLLRGGCSDDAFMDFRAWLIMQGRQIFEQTMLDPDGFDVERISNTLPEFISILDAPAAAYELRTGKRIPQQELKPVELKGPDCSEDDFATLLPRVAAKSR